MKEAKRKCGGDYGGILFHLKKEQNFEVCCNRNETETLREINEFS